MQVSAYLVSSVLAVFMMFTNVVFLLLDLQLNLIVLLSYLIGLRVFSL